MRRRRMWCRSGLLQQWKDGLPPPRASPWYCVTLHLYLHSHVRHSWFTAHIQLFWVYTDLHHIVNLFPLSLFFTNGILKKYWDFRLLILNVFSLLASFFISVNNGCPGKNVQNLDVLFIWKLFQFFLPAVGNCTVCLPSILEKGALHLKINRLCKFQKYSKVYLPTLVSTENIHPCVSVECFEVSFRLTTSKF